MRATMYIMLDYEVGHVWARWDGGGSKATATCFRDGAAWQGFVCTEESRGNKWLLISWKINMADGLYPARPLIDLDL